MVGTTPPIQLEPAEAKALVPPYCQIRVAPTPPPKKVQPALPPPSTLW